MTQQPLDPAVVAKARVLLGHAAIQFVADAHRVELLHIKGYALDRVLTREDRVSTDVDILVRPTQVESLLDALTANGWERTVGFDAGSPFGHAATLHHELWGYADVHRWIPGINLHPGEAFEQLWQARRSESLAGFDCPVPQLTAQRLVQLLHAARSEHKFRADGDTHAAWTEAHAAEQLAVRRLAATLEADVALAAAIGELDRYRGRRDYALWRSVSQGDTRTGEWWARIRAARSLPDALRLLARLPLVNVEHLAVVLGRRPTWRDIIVEFFARPVRGVAEVGRAAWTKVAGR